VWRTFKNLKTLFHYKDLLWNWCRALFVRVCLILQYLSMVCVFLIWCQWNHPFTDMKYVWWVSLSCKQVIIRTRRPVKKPEKQKLSSGPRVIPPVLHTCLNTLDKILNSQFTKIRVYICLVFNPSEVNVRSFLCSGLTGFRSQVLH